MFLDELKLKLQGKQLLYMKFLLNEVKLLMLFELQSNVKLGCQELMKELRSVFPHKSEIDIFSDRKLSSSKSKQLSQF